MPLRTVGYRSLASWLRSIEQGTVRENHPWAVVHGQARVPDYPGPDWYGAPNIASALALAKVASTSDEAARVRALSRRLAMRLSMPRAMVTEYIPSPIGRVVDFAAWHAGIEPCTFAATQVANQRPNVHVLVDTSLPAYLPGAVFTAYASAVAACCSKIAAVCNLRVTVCYVINAQNLRFVEPRKRYNALDKEDIAVGYTVDVKAWMEPWHADTMAWSLCALAAARALPFAWLDCYAKSSESGRLGGGRGYPMPAAACGYVPEDPRSTVVVRVPWLVDIASDVPAVRPADIEHVEYAAIRAFAPCGIRITHSGASRG